ncbi:hypothetical protein L6270_03190 [Candidatus Parcubacteria bacterium]|nr:hypothetical protein [Patescibacteria group bacterium]MBU4308969.1 hypothetical protein [Patescibacteria group bacterium]MBU4431861.1 hypothetical protein [Patescibacteria group bacterium]MBU4577329.1 hypothetical protein [Patescibacteria group bacterium]MCG2697017.1 hypothetical protein [Candidatus Parcubacteria bacterium]
MEKDIEIIIKIPDFRHLLRMLSFYFRKASMLIVTDFINRKWRGLFVLLISIVIYFFGGLSVALMWLLFLLFLVYQWDNRAIAFVAIILLAACPFLIYFKKNDWAELVAIYAYYFLVIMVVLQIVEYKLEQRRANMLKKIWFK